VLKDTILAVLNAEAHSLGADPVTERALEDWISEDLLEKPTEKGLAGGGSEWRYSPIALRAGLEIVRLKASRPSRRNRELRLRLWLLDFHVPIDRVAEDLKSEFERLLKRQFLRNPPRDARSTNGLSERQRKVELRKAGPLDPSLADAGLAPPPDDILKFALESVWASGKASQILNSLEKLISPFASEKGQEVLAGFLRALEPYVAVSGLFGHREWIERSGLESLDKVSASDVLKARRFYQFALAMADSASRGSEFLPSDIPPALGEALSKIARTLRESDEWCVAGLAACAIAAHRAMVAASQTK
jgi:hypothetical protein